MIEFTHVIDCDLLDATASDLAVVNAARISFDTEHDALTKGDEGLIRYLLRNRHGSPFEHGYFKFRLEVPIFEFRDHVRHRAGMSYNEWSGRYSELAPKFYVPLRARMQEGKPGSYVYVDQPEDSELTATVRTEVEYAYRQAWRSYRRLLDAGVAKEQARIVLPVGVYTKVIWSCNPRSLMHFLGLRNAPQAMAEIQVVARQAEAALAAHMPHTYRAFIKNGRTSP